MKTSMMIAVALFLAGCTTMQPPKEDLTVTKTIVSYVEQATPGMMAAAYAAFDNRGEEDTLLEVSCDCADRVEIHHMVGQGDDRKMVVEPAFVVPANSQSAIEPPGLEWHLMLMDVKHPIPVGSEVEMTLLFQNAGPKTYRFRAVDGTRAAWDAYED